MHNVISFLIRELQNSPACAKDTGRYLHDFSTQELTLLRKQCRGLLTCFRGSMWHRMAKGKLVISHELPLFHHAKRSGSFFTFSGSSDKKLSLLQDLGCCSCGSIELLASSNL